MLTELHMESLKAFSGRQTLPLAPITLVFGDNSAGKSSILQSLLLLKQTIDASPDGSMVSTGAHVDLGGFANLVHGHDVGRTVRIGVRVGVHELDEAEGSGRFGVDLAFVRGSAGRAPLDSVAVRWGDAVFDSEIVAERREDAHASGMAGVYEARPGSWPSQGLSDWIGRVLGPRLQAPSAWRHCRDAAVMAAQLDRERAAWNGFPRELTQQRMRALRVRLLADGHSSPVPGWMPRRVEGLGGDSEMIDTAIVAAIDSVVGQSTRTVEGELARIVYLGPSRRIPPRVEPLRSASPVLRRVVEDSGLLGQVNRHLKHLEVPYELEPSHLGIDDPLIEDAVALRLVDHRYPVPLLVNLSDVGVGISQLLPVVVAAAANSRGTVLVEQPELHVHPGLQARLGDVLVAESTTTQFIVETHSEHLMLRLLRHVRRGTLSPSELSVLYVEHAETGEGARVHRLDIDEAGEFVQRWPGGFFKEREDELFDSGEFGALP